MGWFDEQIKQRKNKDDEDFRDAYRDLAEAVMGKKGVRSNDALSQTADAVGMVLRAFHVKSRELPDDITTVDEVLEFQLSPHGIMSRGMQLKKGWRKRESRVMLAKLKESGRIVALLPKLTKGYRYFDPVAERYVSINRFNESDIDENVTVFYRPFPQTGIGIGGLIRYIIENLRPRELILYGVFMYLATMAGLALIQVLDILMDRDQIYSYVTVDIARADFFQGLFCSMAIMAVFAIAFKALFEAIHTRIAGRIERELEFNVSSATMMRVLSLPPQFFGQYSSGELYDRIQHVNDLSSELVEAFLKVGAGGMFSYMYFSEIYENAPSLVIPALITTFATIFVSISTILFNMKRSKEIMLTEARESGMTYALISGIRKIRIAGAEKRAFARWARLHKVGAKYNYRPPTYIKLNATITLAITLFGNAVLYYMAVKNHITVAGYYTFSAAYGVLSSTISSLASVATIIATIKPTLEMAAPILNTMPEVTGERRMVRSISGGVELNNVSFSYGENGPLVLDDLTLKIRPGQYVAIVGETGCGKSTLMRLMLGFEKPVHGSVYYDGRDLQTLDVRSVRRRIGVVLQNGKLFSGNILSNITITAPDLDEDAAWRAAEMAGMADDIRRMPMGMKTIISEGQGGVSGGQKQRLLIARALAPGPKIIMFDEATSALDNITQKIVAQSLDSLKCTRIVIAHRLSTIKNCDRIVVLHGGHIIEDGKFDELMEKDGFFASLVKRQMADA